MANIFNKTNQLYDNPNRNTFQHDHSFHGTFNFGDLYPVMCKEVIPGTSVSINPTIALKMMPMLFPIQSRIKAYLHFYYVPYRTLWKDWKDFIGDTKKGLNKPFINPEFTEIKTGSLADYLGLPTTVAGKQTYLSDNTGLAFDMKYINDSMYEYVINKTDIGELTPLCNLSLYTFAYYLSSYLAGDSNLSFEEFLMEFNNMPYNERLYLTHGLREIDKSISFNNNSLFYFQEEHSNRLVLQRINLNTPGNIFYSGSERYYLFTINKPLSSLEREYYSNHILPILNCKINNKSYRIILPYASLSANIDTSKTDVFILTNIDEMSNCYILDERDTTISQTLLDIDGYENLVIESIDVCTFTNNWSFLSSNPSQNGHYEPLCFIDKSLLSKIYADKGIIDISELSDLENPYFNDDELKIDAGPFRAYESIYNVYYRDDRNNPRIVNGEPIYNEFIPNDAGGLDNYAYKLHKRNWEQDFLTLSVQSPQQGVAPLVGITSRGEFQFKDEENGRLYTAQANYSSDGDTIESFTINSADMPKSSLKQLMTYATEGISISDLRNVNALQRWLEINMRRGYRYKDQIMSHFGVDVRYDELMMPEFIGGMSSDVFVNQINNTAQSEGNPLGSFAGQGSSINKSENTIHHYCQEHGYIIGILSIAPTANYSQLLPKHFTKREILDYYYPEFGHIGFQPIPYKEVAPLSAFLAGKSLDDTFGYQRAWYDYLASNDSVHGLFRTSLKNFVVQRIFNSYPELTPEFLTIDHNDLDDIFAVESSDVSHKFFGEIFFDMKMKLPIPEYGTPKLEV